MPVSPLRYLLFLSILFLSVPSNVFSQEQEGDLRYNPVLLSRPAQRSEPAESRGGGGSLTLPFFDDFSRYSLPTDDPNIPAEWQQWLDTSAYINTHLPLSPPTIGVATLDGLDGHGYPYDFSDEFAYGDADTMTSFPIDLSPFSVDDNVYLLFFFQGGGLGNNPDAEDSLLVDFFSPFGQGEWFQQWSAPGLTDGTFQQVFIQVTQPEFFLDGFQFRFRNYATLSGAYDHWHIDYVVMRQGINPDSFEFDEVAMQYPNHSFLQPYSVMPWTHYIDNPSQFMATTFTAFERNLGPTENIVTGYSVGYQGDVTNFIEQDINPFGNSFQEMQRTIVLNGFQFDPAVNDTCATFDVKVYINPTDLNLQNDTASFKQEFTNYYAYDDGTAERSYAITSAGGSVAVKYRSEIPDTLLGLFIHWLPQGIDVSDQTFLLRVWGDASGAPGSELAENFEFHSPRFYDDGYNVISYYEFDQPVYVDGNFYVGWTQPAAIGLTVGNDKNTNTNPVRLFYRLGLGQPWFQSEITGSVMIRPVFRAGKSEVWNSVEEESLSEINVYPNPTEQWINIQWNTQEQANCVVYDLMGREASRDSFYGVGVHQMDLGSLAAGPYVLVITDSSSGEVRRQTILRR